MYGNFVHTTNDASHYTKPPTMYSHYKKICIRRDPSLPVVKLTLQEIRHFPLQICIIKGQSISYYAKHFSLMTRNYYEVSRSLCCRFRPLLSLQRYTPTNNTFSERRLCFLSRKYFILPPCSQAVKKVSPENCTLDPRRQVQKIKCEK